MSLVRPQELIDCRFFLNESCNKGKNCPFRHSEKARATDKLCRYWSNTPHCEKVGCAFLHPMLASPAAAGASAAPTKSKGSEKSGKDKSSGKSNSNKSSDHNNKKSSAAAPAQQAAGSAGSGGGGGGGGTGALAVIWDIENCSVPKSTTAFDIAQRIRAVVNPNNKLRELVFKALCNTRVLTAEIQKSLALANVEIVQVPDTGKDGATDRAILLALDRFERQTRPPATVVLISGDIDFVGKLSDLRHQAGYTVVVIHSAQAKQELKATVSHVISWKSITDSTSAGSSGGGGNGSQKDKKHSNDSSGGKQQQQQNSKSGGSGGTDGGTPKRKTRQKKGSNSAVASNSKSGGSGGGSGKPKKDKEKAKSDKPKKLKVKCPKQHVLEYIKAGMMCDDYPRNAAPKCDACRRNLASDYPFYHCYKCKDWDMCQVCHTKALAEIKSDSQKDAKDSKSSKAKSGKAAAGGGNNKKKNAKRAPTEAEVQRDGSDDADHVFECPGCVSQFAKVSSLLQHMTATNHRWTCSKCSAQFNSPQALAQHQRDTGHAETADDDQSTAGDDGEAQDDDDEDDDDDDGSEINEDDDLLPDPNYILSRDRWFYCPHPMCSSSKWSSWAERFQHLRQTGHKYRCSECKEFVETGYDLARHEAETGHFHTGDRDDFDYYMRRQFLTQSQVPYQLQKLTGRNCITCGVVNPLGWTSFPSLCFLCLQPSVVLGRTPQQLQPQPQQPTIQVFTVGGRLGGGGGGSSSGGGQPQTATAPRPAVPVPAASASGTGAGGVSGVMDGMSAALSRMGLSSTQKAVFGAAVAAAAIAGAASAVQSSNSKEWSCKMCTFRNSGSGAKCSVCQTPRS